MDLTTEQLDHIADRLAPRLLEALAASLTHALWMSVEQAAAYMKVKPCTVRRLIKKGHLYAKRTADSPSASLIVSREDIDVWLNSERIF
ncbi:MAG: helix-turn-helix domain-containing protein [Pseudomonadota bacterium]